MSLEEGSDKPQGSLRNKRSAEEAAWARAGDPGKPLWTPSREAGSCLGAAVEGTGKELVAVMLDRVYGKERSERKVWPVRYRCERLQGNARKVAHSST